MTPAHVAIIGAGAAGALQAIHLRRAGVPRVTLIERGRVPGRGVAYGTERLEHLLNVPARRMTAYSDRPLHFANWLERHHGGGAESFAPRRVYGDYLSGELASIATGVVMIRGEAIDLVAKGDAEQIVLADGDTVTADAVVIAPGNLEPAAPAVIEPEALGPVWIGDPWSARLTDGLGRADPVILLGTGLTAVDVALTLDACDHRGPIFALSRRGLVPRVHRPRDPAGKVRDPWPATCAGLLRAVRRRSDEIGWRNAVQEVRAAAEGLWRDAEPDERRRFLRHLRPWWDVHRHRVAPAVGDAIERMRSDGRLVAAAGRIVSVEAVGAHAVLHWRPRASDRVESVMAARVVNCTGPELDLARSGERLFRALLGRGRIRVDSCRLGLDVDPACRVVDAAGTPSGRLFAIGPVTRGTFWESVAVPDIRAQAEAVARLLVN